MTTESDIRRALAQAYAKAIAEGNEVERDRLGVELDMLEAVGHKGVKPKLTMRERTLKAVNWTFDKTEASKNGLGRGICWLGCKIQGIK